MSRAGNTPLLKIFGSAEIYLVGFAVNQHIRMDQLIAQMGNPQNIQQSIHNNFIDTFVPNNTIYLIKIRKLIIYFLSAQYGIRLQKRTGGTGRVSNLRPG